MPKRISEHSHRSLIKTITFRSLVLLADGVIFYILTKKTSDALGLTIITNIGSTILYFIHERAWNKIHWGRR